MRARIGALAVLGIGVLLVACAPTSSGDDTGESPATVPDEQESTELLQVSEPHQMTGGTLLEGPTFHKDSDLFLVDVMAPAGAAKVLRVDVDEAEVAGVFTDEVSAFTSAQFHPVDGRLYLTDFLGGGILSMTADGEDVRTEFAGDVEGVRMLIDDIAFAPDGTMFVTDTRGMDGPGWETPGRVVRVDAEGDASVIARDLPSPNGIVFDEEDAGLWVAQYNANRIDYLGLDDTRTSVVSAYPAIHVDGGIGRIDSTAVDADGNIYQAFHEKAEILVFAKTGEKIGTIRVPGEGLESATNIAIRPGATDGYLVVSGPAGGFVHTFQAYGEGIRQSNGG
ncbi:SMP-30/gluconolactonase/LRE family protein [Microbacterium sp. NPDC089696]|uniref:SMP-30/gluconolactonase/LRE family protein n=1 Tax=Microbacterium sp. NPDC089696 TaxID=3364199 RepID=UPI003819D2D8